MKTAKLLILALISFAFFSCEEEEPIDTDFNAQQKIVFWSDFEGPPIDVYVNDSFKGTITAVGSSAPNCESNGNVTMDVGNHNSIILYAEEQQTGRVWESAITIPQNTECYRFRLHE